MTIMARLSCLPCLDNMGEGGKTFIKRFYRGKSFIHAAEEKYSFPNMLNCQMPYSRFIKLHTRMLCWVNTQLI